MKTKRCLKCGALYPDDMKQCPSCGNDNNQENAKPIENKPHYQYQERQQSQKLVVACPYCKSNNTKKITSTEKVVNIALFGIFGNKRKYQWHCNNCNSDF